MRGLPPSRSGWMAKNVFVLGAGASRSAGAPLMTDFLDKTEDLRASRRATVDLEAFDLVLERIHHLRRAQSNAQFDADNIEAVLAAFEAATLFGCLVEAGGRRTR